ncbi:MAG: EamA family transporter [Bacilli bacterium]|nr:EamA family transporter [Bacilli bacterium]
MKYILTVLYLICTTGGMTFMKLGGDSLSLSFKNGITFKIGFVTFLGFFLYLISFLLWQRMIIKYDLSILVPVVTGIVQVLVLIISHFVFKESLNIVSLIGVALIIIGIVVLAFGTK